MTHALRIFGILLAAFGGFILFGVAIDWHKDPSVVGVIFCLVVIAAGVALVLRAQKQLDRDRRVSLSNKLLALGKSTGTLTVARVSAHLELTADEAAAALTQLSRDGLAVLDVDENGSPFYRVEKI